MTGAPHTPPPGGGPVLGPGKALESSTPATPVRHPPNLVAVETEPGEWGVNHIDGTGNQWTVCECGHHNAEVAMACAREALDTIGRQAFETYNHCVGGMTWNGLPIPGWDAVTEHVRDGWRMAALAVSVAETLR